ncbi:PASTA domain-containing protein [Capnocytophaga canimorsus]|uniref:PASTA domain-containing protein n=1 Tax=Capnocytophaga canimorsus TaxID=28188 RepID=UPI001BB407CF|nr:PASTA domain-containing protein [Capnocytophaga canimorsus]
MKIINHSMVRLWGKHIALAILVLFLLIFVLLKMLKVWTNHGEYVVVPDLSKKTLSEVEETLKAVHLRYEVLDSTTYNPKFPKYSVISQNPEAAQQVKENRKIYLTINPSGYRKVTIPKVIQITRRSAEAILKSVGLEVGKITYVDDIGKDMVLEMSHRGQKVNPGEMLIKTAKIDLVCGNGKDPNAPDLPIQEGEATSEEVLGTPNL